MIGGELRNPVRAVMGGGVVARPLAWNRAVVDACPTRGAAKPNTRPPLRLPGICGLLLLVIAPVHAETRRVVIIKVDGLSDERIERALHETDPRTGRSRLPWIQRLFVDEGVRLRNFYVRGISLSVPSWSLLDTGRPLQIHGNVEFDRYTLKPYDYMNFFPFYVDYAMSRRVDMPGVEVLDDGGIPLLLDHFALANRWQSFELYQRGVRWTTLGRSLTNRFATRSIRDLIDEWATGFQMSSSVTEQLERELIAKLADPHIAYLDYFTGDFDHIAHLTRDWPSQREVLQQLDTFIGRVAVAIERSPLRDSTVLVVVSDHGMNTSDDVFSQGYDLLGFFKSRAGGGHHVVTNRYPMDEYKIRGLYPFISEVVNASPDSFYLAGESKQYPTALLDLDGNERACVYLRNSALNAIQIYEQLLNERIGDKAARVGVARALMAEIDRRRPQWTSSAAELDFQLSALRRNIAAIAPGVESQKKTRWTAEDRRLGRDQEARRGFAHLERMRAYEHGYSAYRAALKRLLDVTEDDLLSGKRLDLVPQRFMGDLNSIYDLQNYVIGPDPATPGALLRIDYFDRLASIQVRNTVQEQLSSNPVDFIATRVPVEGLRRYPNGGESPDGAVWLYAAPDRQGLVLTKTTTGRPLFRYMPVANLTEDASGAIQFEHAAWKPGLPLHLCEDGNLDTGGVSREEWLEGWHTDLEWLRATARARYSNGVTGIVEEVLEQPPLEGFYAFTRRAAESDFIVFARDHWNFNVRSFNPGGNHGSFLRASMLSTLMFNGGVRTGTPHGLEVEQAYDSFSFAPTILKLLHIEPLPSAAGPMPGPVIEQVLPQTRSLPPDEPSSNPPPSSNAPVSPEPPSSPSE